MKINKLIIGFIVLLLVAGIFWYAKNSWFFPNPDPTAGSRHSVVLTKDGFQPAEITIHQGDTVVFMSTSGRDYWPASDLHPTHGV